MYVWFKKCLEGCVFHRTSQSLAQDDAKLRFSKIIKTVKNLRDDLITASHYKKEVS